MARMDPILRHAITPPVFDRGKFHRARLVDEIHANTPRKLIVIAAPAGYGKTTLLADFTAHTDSRACWVRLTEADQDVMRLDRTLLASLERRYRRLRGKLNLESLIGSEPEALARILAELIEEHIDETFVIILDDIHLMNHSSQVLRYLDAFLDVLPEQVTLVVSGREVPEISLAKLMADGNLAGLGPHDLALDEAELRSLAKERFGSELKDQQIQEIMDVTRGWVTGVLLSGRLGEGRSDGWLDGTRPMVYEYLASVVLNRQPDDMRRFMLDTAVLPVMTADACDATFERSDSDRYLRRLVSQGLFVTTTGESPKTYEYHPQFRQFLLEVLKGGDERRLNRYRRRAAQYLAEHGLIEPAIGLYMEAGSVGKAASLADKNARELYVMGRWGTLEQWGERLRELGASTPRVFLYLAITYSSQGKQNDAEEALRDVKRMTGTGTAKTVRAHAECIRGLIAHHRGQPDLVMQAADKAEELLSGVRNRRLRALCLRLKGLAAATDSGDLPQAERLAAQSVKLLRKTTEKHALAAALIDLSNIQAAMGRAMETHATSLEAHEILAEIGSPLGLAMSFNNLAFDAHARGNYEEALELYQGALNHSRLAAASWLEVSVLYGQADLFNDLNLALQAAELYAQGLSLATREERQSLMRFGCIRTAVLHRRRGGNSLALEWVKRAMELTDEGSPLPSIQIQVAAVEAKASPQGALSRLNLLLESSSDRLDASEMALALYFKAAAEYLAGDPAASIACFGEALDWAGSRGTEQELAGELLHNEELQEFLRSRLKDNPVLAIVLQRVATMQAVGQKYQELDEDLGPAVEHELMALGQATVARNGEELADLTPFTRELLFYLVDHQRVDRDVLIERFWPEYPPGRQTANLHTAVYALRRAIGKETIVCDGSVYSVYQDHDVEYDVARFERAATIADTLPLGDPRKLFALTEAINSYGGPYLPEFGSNWVSERRRALELRFIDLVATYADEALLRDQPLRAISTLREALKIDPTRDDLNLRILEALGRLGRRSEIVSHYERYVRQLADELGLDPSESVRDAYTRLIS